MLWIIWIMWQWEKLWAAGLLVEPGTAVGSVILTGRDLDGHTGMSIWKLLRGKNTL